MKQETDVFDAGWRPQPIGPRQVVRILWRNLVPLILVPAVLLALAAAYLVRTPPTFSSSTQLAVDADGASADALNTTLVSHMETIASEAITAKVIERLGLAEGVTVETGGLERIFAEIRERLGLEVPEEMTEEERQAMLEDMVAGALAVQRVGDSAIIRISYFAGSPEFAAEIANAYAETYVESLAEQSSRSTQRRLDFLQTRFVEAQQQISASYREIQQIRSADGLEIKDFQDLAARVAALQQEEAEIREEEATVSIRLSLMEQTDASDALAIAASQTKDGPALFDAYKEAAANLAQLRDRHGGPGAIARLESSVEQLRRQLDQLLSVTRSGLEQQLAVLKARRERARTDFANDLELSSRNDWSRILLAEHQAEVYKNISADYLQKREAAQNTGDASVHVMSQARPEVQPVAPNYALVLVLAATLGLVLGIAIAILREWSRRSATSPSQQRPSP